MRGRYRLHERFRTVLCDTQVNLGRAEERNRIDWGDLKLDKSEGNIMNYGSSEEDSRSRPDPIIQGRDSKGGPAKGQRQPTEIVPSVSKPVPVAAGELLPTRFIGPDAPMRPTLAGNDIVEALFRYKWTILIVFFVVTVPAIAAIWTQMVPKYRARAEVRVRPIIPSLVFRTEDNGTIPFYTSFVNTQVSIIRSLDVLQRVLDQQEVQNTQWYKQGKNSLIQKLRRSHPEPPIERLRDILSVAPRRGTEIIDVSFTAASSKDARVIVDAVVEQYIRYIAEKTDASKDKLYRQLVEQYKSLENEILGREKVSAELRKSLGTDMPQELISSRRLRLDEMEARLENLQQNIALLEWQRKKLEELMQKAETADGNDIAVASADGLQEQPAYHEDEEWRQLDIAVRTRKHEIENSVLSPKHPDMVRMANDLKFAEELLRLREAQLDEQWRRRSRSLPASVPSGAVASATSQGAPLMVPGVHALGPMAGIGYGGLTYEEQMLFLEHQLERSKEEEKLLVAELEKQRKDFEGLFESAQLLEKENNTLAHKRELFTAVRQRLDQKNIERKVPGSIEVLSRAFAPSKPSEDRRVVFTAMALFMGLGLGGGLAFLRSVKSQAIYAAKDMPQPMQVPLLGHIPVTNTKRPPEEEVSPAMIESVRVVRTTLLSRLNGQECTTVLVTSAAAGTGKSSFAIMLGKSLARAGKKVLLVDADFRKTTLSKRLNLADKSGFIESLQNRSVDKRHVFPTNTPGLSVIPAGSQNGGDLVFEETANGAFKACINQLRKDYNIILLDSSPIVGQLPHSAGGGRSDTFEPGGRYDNGGA